MKPRAYHLNLLKEAEKVSSSPVRLRVLLPIGAMLSAIGMLVWWGVLTGQLLLAKSSLSRLEEEIRVRAEPNRKALLAQAEANELESRLEQLQYYSGGRRTWGETLKSFTEVMPLKVQLTRLEIPAQPPQDLRNPRNPRVMLFGPTGVTEQVSLVLRGRTPKETPVISLMESLEGDAFTNNLVIVKDPRDPRQSPKVKSFRQEVAQREDSSRMLSFEIEYRAKERRFAK